MRFLREPKGRRENTTSTNYIQSGGKNQLRKPGQTPKIRGLQKTHRTFGKRRNVNQGRKKNGEETAKGTTPR